MAWYDAGTVKVAVNSATVTGTGTKWLAGARQGEAFVAPDGRLYEVLNIASDTSLTLTKPYIGATATGQKYSLAPMQGYVKELADRVAALLLLSQEEWGSVLKAADLQAHPNDAAKGKILTAGAFGLGATNLAASFPSAFLDDLDVPSGIYYVPTAVEGRPDNRAGIVLHRQAGTAGAQIFITSAGMFHRGRASNVYSGWKNGLSAGDFGFGGGQAAPPNGKALSNPTGWYYASGAAPSFGGGAFFLDLAYNTTAINSGLRISTDPYTDNFYMNGAVSGQKTYRDACKLVHDKNIVGPIAGGSVIESGSNANGKWVKYADGTLICWSGKIMSNWIDLAEGNIYKSATNGWTFPMAFVNADSYTLTGDVQASAAAIWISTGLSRSASFCDYKLMATFSWTVGLEVRLCAIGRWKA